MWTLNINLLVSTIHQTSGIELNYSHTKANVAFIC